MSNRAELHRAPLVLLTGATGYVGGRLLPLLEARGCRVRCLARRPEVVRQNAAAHTEVVAGDLLDAGSLDAAFDGVTTAYYLVHSMGATGSFEVLDREAAEHFGRAARKAGVTRIIYLGGLGSDDEELSAHLRSRHEVGNILRESGVPVLEFRASIVIGSGSLSFELVRALVERLPIMITPRWVGVRAQPIAIEDLLEYLVAALEAPASADRIYEIGGADRVSYADLMRAYAHERGLVIRMIPVPALTPYLSSLWLGLVTPLYARIGRKLIESIVHATVVGDQTALQTFAVRPMGMREAVRRALGNEDAEFSATHWHDALSSAGTPRQWGGVLFGGRLVDSRTITVTTTAARAFAAIERIGGANGWYAWNGLWRLRGAADLLVGGVGMRRGRPPRPLRVGDAVDFWRVEAIERGRRLRLAAEMTLPGRAWLDFEVSEEDGSTVIRQTAIFDPLGLAGQLYWYSLYPVHQFVFAGMLRGIAAEAQRAQ